ncbi:4'-phosphopantetheinyl transferase [Haloferula luteola]|uniref:4'-phosphopantetheinyl transferase n=1 Tax=Haloferula luteola TaxID=595692 RepID=A0A840VC51_9BACT|nr:4'-phosphopantetheinyl transferase superfamily protein [Haloferula luteola]MBB5351500.1 4'-phosphopantetheinyl transferase [Haloferula luteola]
MPVTLHLLDPLSIREEDTHRDLSLEETKRARRFAFPHLAARWRAFRALTRRHLASHLAMSPRELIWREADWGKPFLEGCPLHFNLTHTDHLGVLAICNDHPVGVDLERTDRGRDLVGCETHFCHPEEIHEIQALTLPDREHRLIEIWTSKEAALKCLGTGLSHPPQQVRIGNSSATGSLQDLAKLTLYHPHHPSLTGHTFALATTAPSPEISWAP